jgi:UDP-N-acetylmuramyl tripeptide synthase
MIAGQVIPSTHTTPDAVNLNALLKQMVDEGCEYAFMEVSSHAVHQRRIAASFAGALFSTYQSRPPGLPQDFDEYIKARKDFSMVFLPQPLPSPTATIKGEWSCCRIRQLKSLRTACGQ